jgi:hypothetical protein
MPEEHGVISSNLIVLIQQVAGIKSKLGIGKTRFETQFSECEMERAQTIKVPAGVDLSPSSQECSIVWLNALR